MGKMFSMILFLRIGKGLWMKVTVRVTEIIWPFQLLMEIKTIAI